jgi:hypothetical protein
MPLRALRYRVVQTLFRQSPAHLAHLAPQPISVQRGTNKTDCGKTDGQEHQTPQNPKQKRPRVSGGDILQEGSHDVRPFRSSAE